MIKASDCASFVARLKSVESCPRTKEEWKAASERKKNVISKNTLSLVIHTIASTSITVYKMNG